MNSYGKLMNPDWRRYAQMILLLGLVSASGWSAEQAGSARRKYLGIEMAQSFKYGEPNGVLVVRTVEGYPAAQTLQPGDIIFRVDGTPVNKTAELPPALAEATRSSSIAVLVFMRAGEEQIEAITLLEKPPPETAFKPQAECSVRVLHDAATNRVVVMPAAYFSYLMEQTSNGLEVLRGAGLGKRGVYHTLNPASWAPDGAFDVAIPAAFLQEHHEPALLTVLGEADQRLKKLGAFSENQIIHNNGVPQPGKITRWEDAANSGMEIYVTNNTLVWPGTPQKKLLGLRIRQAYLFGKPDGMEIVNVADNVPAARLLEGGDIIQKLEGTEISTSESWDQARRFFSETTAKESLLHIKRKGETKILQVSLTTQVEAEWIFSKPDRNCTIRIRRDAGSNPVAIFPAELLCRRLLTEKLPYFMETIRKHSAEGTLQEGVFDTNDPRLYGGDGQFDIAIPIHLFNSEWEEELVRFMSRIPQMYPDSAGYKKNLIVHNNPGEGGARIAGWQDEQEGNADSLVAKHVLVRASATLPSVEPPPASAASPASATTESDDSSSTSYSPRATKAGFRGCFTATFLVPLNTIFLDWGDELFTVAACAVAKEEDKADRKVWLKNWFREAFEEAYAHFALWSFITTFVGTGFSLLGLIAWSTVRECTKWEAFRLLFGCELIEGLIVAAGEKSTLGYVQDPGGLARFTLLVAIIAGFAAMMRAKGTKAKG